MNNVALTGYLTDKAKVDVCGNGVKRAVFTLAVRNDDAKDSSDFFNCVAFGQSADFIENGFQSGRYLKGCRVDVSGRVHINSFKNQNGENRRSMEVRVLNSYSEKSKDAPAQPSEQQGYAAPQQGYAAPQQGYPASAPAQQQGYAPAPQQGYPANAPAQQGYPANAPSQQQEYAAAPQQPGNQSPMPNGYPASTPAQQQGYAAAPQQGYAAPQQGHPANAPAQQQGYAAAPQQSGNQMPNGYPASAPAQQQGYAPAPQQAGAQGTQTQQGVGFRAAPAAPPINDTYPESAGYAGY